MRRPSALAGAAVLAALAGAAGWWMLGDAGQGAGSGARSGGVALPSGRTATLQEVVTNVPGTSGLATHFRFVAPWVADDPDPQSVFADMEALCATYALPRLSPPLPAQVVIALADREVPFGEAAPDARQMIEAFRIDGAACIWEQF